jgi:hypothetical protein
MKLLDHAFNVYSQFGEDGILQKIFGIIGIKYNLCVDVGSWDGIYCSNVCNLYRNGWNAVLIEGNKKKFEELIKNTHWWNCNCINEFIKDMSIVNNIKNMDLLSIDIDGDDYYLLKDLKSRPRVIVCEYNPTIPSHIYMVGRKDNNFGCSALALKILAESKGYSLIAMTESNCIFVTNELHPKFEDYDTDFESIFIKKNLTYVITDYSGNYVFSRKPCYGFEKQMDYKVISS